METFKELKLVATKDIFLQLAGLATVIFLSRLFFIDAGYGTDPDSFRMALAAQKIALTGSYHVSRFPGYPVPEYVMSLFHWGGPVMLNCLTAIMSAIAAIFFALILIHIKCRAYLFVTFAFAFMPIVYINSVNSMDYIWAVAFILVALFLALKKKPYLAGIALGIAVGCRLTTVIFALPLLMLLWRETQNKVYLLKFTVTIVASSIVVYLPSLYTYGFDFLSFFPGAYPSIDAIIGRVSYSLFGRIGTYAILVAIVAALALPKLTLREKNERSGKRYNFVWWVSILLSVVLFFRLPYEAAYLIPIIPFILLLFADKLKHGAMVVLSMAFIASPFVQPCRSAGICWGDIINDTMERQKQIDFVTRIKQTGDTLPHNSIFVVAWWFPMIQAEFGGNNKNPEYSYLLDSTLLETATSDSSKIYYISDAFELNKLKHGIDLSQVGIDINIKISNSSNNKR